MDVVFGMVTTANAAVQYVGEESEEWVLGTVITRTAFSLFLSLFLFFLFYLRERWMLG